MKLPAEDAVALEQILARDSGDCIICVLRLPRIANFDDLDPLRLEPGVSLRFIGPGEAIPGNARLVIVPGSKSTMADFAPRARAGMSCGLPPRPCWACAAATRCSGRIHDPTASDPRARSMAWAC
jgi:adenosylcobyric acid synthase